MKKAKYFEKINKKDVKCTLCPHNCIIKPNHLGICNVRKNIDGTLYSLVYEHPCSIGIDPIEKKPLYHFFPGNKTLSIATIGCNFSCSFCQNWQISKAETAQIERRFEKVSPEKVIELCKENNCKIISYTYTEPTIFYEYMLDIAKLARREGIKNIIVSNGFINEKPLRELCKYIDAANIDLKAFNNEFYKKNCKARLDPVLKTLKILKQKNVWLEITNLIIPGENDNINEIKKMINWISEELGKDVPLHFSKFHPDYKMKYKESTNIEILNKAEEVAKQQLDYVYVGNVMRTNNTICPKCKKQIIQRSFMGLEENKLKQSKCPFCDNKISGIWE